MPDCDVARPDNQNQQVLNQMIDREHEKELAAARAVLEVRAGMLVGLGTGSTATHAVRHLAGHMAKGLDFEAVATSRATEAFARNFGIKLVPYEDALHVDLTLDGADEIDGQLRAIKGGGGAFLREKRIATISDRVIAMVDSSKLVTRLGSKLLPIEMIPDARDLVSSAITELGESEIRRGEGGNLFVTDQGNYILDLQLFPFADLEAVADILEAQPGVCAHGLFLTEIDEVFLGRGNFVDRSVRISD